MICSCPSVLHESPRHASTLPRHESLINHASCCAACTQVRVIGWLWRHFPKAVPRMAQASPHPRLRARAPPPILRWRNTAVLPESAMGRFLGAGQAPRHRPIRLPCAWPPPLLYVYTPALQVRALTSRPAAPIDFTVRYVQFTVQYRSTWLDSFPQVQPARSFSPLSCSSLLGWMTIFHSKHSSYRALPRFHLTTFFFACASSFPVSLLARTTPHLTQQ